MPAGLVYQLMFKDVKEGFSRTDIYDTQAPDADVTQIVTLESAETPVTVSTIDNEEDKFTPIRSQQLTMSFLSNDMVTLSNFADGPDDRFLVESYYNGNIIFRGFLSLADNTEAFLPPRNVVTLTASDKLGALKDIALIDSDGKNPAGKYRIIELLTMALNLTGQQLNVNVVHNLKPGGGVLNISATFLAGANVIATSATNFFYVGQRIVVTNSASNNGTFTVTGMETIGALFISVAETLVAEAINPVTITDALADGHIYDVCYLDARTFEDEINETEDAYTVLEKILGFDCSLFYWQGSWWIVRTDERELDELRWASYSPDGTFNGYITGSFNTQIGLNEFTWFANESTEWHPSREIGEVKLTLNYNYAEELICNQDFSRGTTEPLVSGIGDETFELIPECIDFYREGSPSTYANLDQTPSVGSKGQLIKKFEGGMEKESYLHIEIAAGFRHYFKMRPLDVSARDKLEIGFNFRTNGDDSVTNQYPALIVLQGDDGSIWEWTYDQPAGTGDWVLRTSGNAPFAGGWHADLSGLNASEWQGISSTSRPIPVSGQLFIRLVHANNGYSLEFSDLNINYIPFINGSYPKYTGQSNIVKRDDPGYLSKIDEEVFIGNPPAPAMKGGIYTLNANGRFYLLPKFTYNGVTNSFGWHQVQAVWNQYRNAVRVFEYEVVTDPTYIIPHLIHRYQITDITGATQNRYFIMITFEMDLRLNGMRGTMPEVYRTDLGKIYSDPFTFKYVTR